MKTNFLIYRHFAQGGARNLLQRGKVRADDLDRIGAFKARQPFLDVVLNVLREIKIDADEFLFKLRVKFFDKLLFGHRLGPLVERFQRHEEFGVEKTCGVAAVVGTAVLGRNGDNFGMAEE